MPPEVITRDELAAAPFEIPLGANDAFEPLSAFAHFDGTSAAGAFLPCLTYYTQDGKVFARAFPADDVAAGASADVSWFPGLTVAPAQASTGLALGTARAFYNTGSVSVNTGTRTHFNLAGGAHQDPAGIVTTSGSSLVIAATGLYTLMYQTNFPTADIGSTKAFKMELETTQAVANLNFNVRNSWSLSGPLPGTENPDSSQTLTLSMAAGDTIDAYYTHNFGSAMSIRAVVFIAQVAV